MSFFAPGPRSREPEEHREPYERQPSWRGPSEDEVGRPSAASFVLARTDSVAVAIRTIRVHRDGCLFDVQWILRRTVETAQQWREAREVAFGHRAGREKGEHALQFGVALSDGSAARTTDRLDWRDPGPGPHLVDAGGSGSSGGTERVHGDLQLWLHPLPPEPTMDLVCAWPRFELTETRRTLDVAVVHEAAAAAHLIWPEDADLALARDE